MQWEVGAAIYKRICLLRMVTVPLDMQGGKELNLEEGMSAYSSILAWRIPWKEEPGRLLSTVSHKNWTQLK